MNRQDDTDTLWLSISTMGAVGLSTLLAFLGVLFLSVAVDKLPPSIFSARLPQTAATVISSKVVMTQGQSTTHRKVTGPVYHATIIWQFVGDGGRKHTGLHRETFGLETTAQGLIEKFPVQTAATVVFERDKKKPRSWIVVKDGLLGPRVVVNWTVVFGGAFFGLLFLGIAGWFGWTWVRGVLGGA